MPPNAVTTASLELEDCLVAKRKLGHSIGFTFEYARAGVLEAFYLLF